jgi:hypothetical protein
VQIGGRKSPRCVSARWCRARGCCRVGFSAATQDAGDPRRLSRRHEAGSVAVEIDAWRTLDATPQITAGAGVKGQRAAQGIRLDNVGGGDDQIVKNIDLERAALVLRDSEGARE